MKINCLFPFVYRGYIFEEKKVGSIKIWILSIEIKQSGNKITPAPFLLHKNVYTENRENSQEENVLELL